LNPLSGKNEHDQKIRLAKREKVLKGIDVLHDLPSVGIFPNFGPLPDTYYPEYAIVHLNEKEIEKFAEKIVRGIVYVKDKFYVDNSYEFKLYVVEDKNVAAIYQMLETFGHDLDRRPGLIIRRALVENEKVTGIYFIEIRGRFRFFIMLMPKSMKDRLIELGLITKSA
jgi:hypothetical protein